MRCFVSVVGIWHCYWEYANYKQRSASISEIGFTTNFSVYLQVQETWLAFCEFRLKCFWWLTLSTTVSGGCSKQSLNLCVCMCVSLFFFPTTVIIISIAEAIILLTVIFLRNRIRIAITLIQESSKWVKMLFSQHLSDSPTHVICWRTRFFAEPQQWEISVCLFVCVFHRAIGHMMSSLLYPLITFVLLLVCVAYWGTTALYPFTLWTRICGKTRFQKKAMHFFTTVTNVPIRQKVPLVLNAFLDIWPLQERPSTK